MSNPIAEKFKIPARYGAWEESVWNEFNDLAQKLKPVNLGQGCSDYAAPKQITDALIQVAKSDDISLQQYARGFGHLRLVKVLAKLYSNLIGRVINPATEILITGGAYGALFSTIHGHVEAGDEVIIIEPFFDCYEPMVRTAGGIPRFTPLRYKQKASSTISSADFALERTELESLFNSKTKAIILNSPNNPLGKVYNLQELTIIADLCKQWNVLCISDEVYEWMVYKPYEHIRIASLPDMWERTITIGSAGKTFSVTGWKTGWAYGPSNLMNNLRTVHQNTVHTNNTPVQEALAIEFERNVDLLETNPTECYFNSLAVELSKKKEFMVGALKDGGMNPIIPEGGFFIVADWSLIEDTVDLSEENDEYKDVRMAKWMTKHLGVLGIPPSAFYSEKHKRLAQYYIRFCFMKKEETLRKAANLLKISNL